MTMTMIARSSLVALLGIGALCATACSDSGGAGTGGSASTTSNSTTTGTGGTGGLAAPSFVASFDPTKGELPEGLALGADGNTAYVGFAGTGKVIKVSLADGSASDHGNIPPPPPNAGFMLGLAFDGAGDLYAGVAAFQAGYQAGIYRIPKGGGDGALFASDPKMVFPNGLVFNAKSELLVADSTGTIFKVAPDKTVTTWFSDATLLGGDPASPCASGLNIGANGIAVRGDAVYVTNSDRAQVVKIDVNADGSAGAGTVFVAPDCAKLGGIDGLFAGPSGALYAATSGTAGIAAIDADAKVTTLANDAIFQGPASLVPALGEKELYVTNFAFAEAQKPGGKPAPGLIVLPIAK